ncbi:MAG: large subunit ribosomal protein [Chloroflexota bacterium]|jgi:large subunit ribosomal protein L24|nr:large subunit ribosomal protein [Chloroflexota bacterium]
MATPRFLDIRAGDTVVVVTGKDRGKRGVVERTLPSGAKIVVRGVNLHKRHTRAGAQRTRSGSTTNVMQGGIVDFEAPLAYSNVMLVCPSCDRPTRIRHSDLPDGNRGRVCVHCGEVNEQVTSR